MKNILAIAVLWLAFAVTRSRSKGLDRQTVSRIRSTSLSTIGHRRYVKDGAAAVDQYEADDIVSIDPGGRVTDKVQDKKDSSGDLKFQSNEISDLKIHVFDNTAVVAGTSTLTGSFKGEDISGRYRYTDVWVKRNGKWQVVATQATKATAVSLGRGCRNIAITPITG